MTVTLLQGDSAQVLKTLDAASIDLTVTSPPYDNLRTYKGNYQFDFETIAQELYRVTKPGGVVVWVVGDATINGSETGTSFRQALYFMGLGFNLHDTMIWDKGGFSAVGALQNRYAPVFEYMFIYSKDFPKIFNPIKDRQNIHRGELASGTIRKIDGSTKPMSKVMKIHEKGQRFNIWTINPQGNGTGHPAPFPESLARDHILSWSNPGDTVLDPFLGSGTTGKMAVLYDRNFIGIEIESEYMAIAERRIHDAQQQMRLPMEVE